MKNKKIYLDMFLNIFAAGVPIVVLQLIIYPMVSRRLEPETYGMMISIYAFIILVQDSFGKSINNIRLINSDEKENRKGDYNIVLTVFIVLSIIITAIGLLYYNSQAEIDSVSSALIIITSIFFMIDSYLIVYFRIRLNYTAILVNAVLMSAGFLVGYAIYLKTGKWIYIFFIGHLVCFVYLMKSTGLYREPFKKTSRYKSIIRDTTLLMFSMFLSQGMTQADKLLLYPLLGGATLSIYYTASLAGKVLSLATGPVNSVILSYIAGRDHLSRSLFKKYMLLSFVSCSLISIAILVLSRPVLGFLFPRYVDDAMAIIPYTTANIFFFVLAGMLTPIVMKYCDIYWQIIINGIGFALYVSLSIVFLKLFGIVGFCLGIGISHFTRLIIMIVVYLRKTRDLIIA